MEKTNKKKGNQEKNVINYISRKYLVYKSEKCTTLTKELILQLSICASPTLFSWDSLEHEHLIQTL